MKIIYILLLTITSLFSINIDKTWFDNTNDELQKIYNDQNKKLADLYLTSSGDEKEQLDYQKILLKKLLKKVSEQNDLTLSKPYEIKDIDNYMKNIKLYVQIEKYSNNIEKISNSNNSKLQTLEDQINKLTNKEEISTINSQLLYALYTIENKQNKQYLSQIDNLNKEYKNIFIKALKEITLVEKEKIDDRINELEQTLNDILKEERRLSLAYDKAQISENDTKVKSLEKDLLSIKSNKSNLIEDLIYIKVEKLLIPLQNKKSKYFEEYKYLVQFAQDNSSISYQDLFDLLKFLSREYIGITKSTFADTKEGFLDVAKFSWNEMNKPYIAIGEGISILDISKFLLIFIIGFSIATLYKRKITNLNLKNSSPSTKTMLANLGFYFFVFITFVFALNSIGIDLSSLTILVGALSVGIGFGLQNIVSNFISGIILIFEKSIQVGNIIQIENEVRGKVTQINMRSSVITTFDNIDIIIPNSTLMQNNVVNLTFADDIRRLHIPFGVAYGTEAKFVINTILEELKHSDLIYIKDDNTKEPRVWMTGMGASSVDFKLLVWINANANKSGLDSSGISDFLIFIYETLNKYNIEIPFPQMDVHIKKEKEEIL